MKARYTAELISCNLLGSNLSVIFEYLERKKIKFSLVSDTF